MQAWRFLTVAATVVLASGVSAQNASTIASKLRAIVVEAGGTIRSTSPTGMSVDIAGTDYKPVRNKIATLLGPNAIGFAHPIRLVQPVGRPDILQMEADLRSLNHIFQPTNSQVQSLTREIKKRKSILHSVPGVRFRIDLRSTIDV